MDWSREVNLLGTNVSSFLCGGAIVVIQHQVSQRIHIPIYSSGGVLMSTIIYDNGYLVNVGWSSSETLIIINNEGLITEYGIDGIKISDYKIPGVSLHSAKIFCHNNETYILALTTSLSFIIKRGLNNPFDNNIDISLFNEVPVCWTPYYSQIHNDCFALLCGQSGQFIMRIAENQATKLEFVAPFEYNHFIKIVVSVDHKHVALLSDTNYIWCGSIDLDKMYFLVACDPSSVVSRLAWCAGEAISYVSDGNVVLQGRENDNYVYFYDEPVALLPEIDGVRIVSKSKHSFIQKVPTCLENLYMVSNEPSSILLDAYNHYKIKSYKTIEMIDQLGENIEAAIENVIDCAVQEWDIPLQKILLKTAMYGRSFHKISNKDAFYKTCQILRTLNNLKMPFVSIPMTFDQMKLLQLSDIIDRLLNRKLFTLGYELCQINHSNDLLNKLLTFWAREKIRTTKKPESEIAKEILEILSTNPNICIDSIVSAALSLEKIDLAIKLVEYNSPSDTVVLTLLKVGNINRAIKAAVDSGDTWLIYSVIIYMKNNLPANDFLLRLSSNPVLNAMGIKYLKEFHPDQLILLFKQDDKIKRLAEYKLLQSSTESFSKRKEILNEVNELAKQKGVLKQTCTNYLNLYDLQQKMESQNQFQNITGSSIISTLVKICDTGNIQEALKFKSDFAIPDSRFYWTAISTLAKRKLWSNIDSLFEMKKNALPMISYCDILIKFHAPVQEIDKYATKLVPNQRYSVYVKANLLEKAGEIAILSKNKQMINEVISLCKVGVDDNLMESLKKHI